MSSKIMEGSAD